MEGGFFSSGLSSVHMSDSVSGVAHVFLYLTWVCLNGYKILWVGLV